MLIETSLQTTVWLAFDAGDADTVVPGQPVLRKRGVAGVSQSVLLRNAHVLRLVTAPRQPGHRQPDRTLWLASRKGDTSLPATPVFCNKHDQLLGFAGPLQPRQVDGILHIHVVVAGRVRADCTAFNCSFDAGAVTSVCGRHVTTLVAGETALLCLHSATNVATTEACTCK